LSLTFLFFRLYNIVLISRYKFSYPQCTCQDPLCCLYTSNELLSIYYWCQVVNIWHTLTDLAITGKYRMMFYPFGSYLWCSPNKSFNFEADDGNLPSKFITCLQSVTYFFLACVNIRQKFFLAPDKAVFVTNILRFFKVLVSLQTRTASSLTSKSITWRTFITNSCL